MYESGNAHYSRTPCSTSNTKAVYCIGSSLGMVTFLLSCFTIHETSH